MSFNNTFPSHTLPFLVGGHRRVVLLQLPKMWALLALQWVSELGIFSPDGLAYFTVKQSDYLLPYWGAIKWLVFVLWPFIALPCFHIGGQSKSERILFIFHWLIWVPARSTTPLSPLHSSILHFYHYFGDIRLLHTKHCQDPSQEEVPAAKTLRMKKMQQDSRCSLDLVCLQIHRKPAARSSASLLRWLQ